MKISRVIEVKSLFIYLEYIDGNNYNYIPPNKSVTFNVIHNCDALITNSNYWSVINV